MPPTPEEMTAALEKAESERAEATAKVAKLEQDVADLKKAAEKPEEPAEPVIKADELPEPVRQALAKAEEERVALSKRAEAAEQIAKEERDQRIEREFVAKAESTLPHIGTPTDTGRLLKSASQKLSKEEYDALEQRLTAANEQIAKSELFKSYGVDGEGSKPTSGEEALLAKADEIRKADPNVSRVEAMRQAARDPELARRYTQGR